jgi:hypothetical protein
MIITTEGPTKGIVNLRLSESILTPLPASTGEISSRRLSDQYLRMLSDVIGITHPTATAMTPRIGGVMIITQITESIVITERMTGVITGITGTEVTLTIQTIANTEITEATGISAHTEIMEVIGNMMDTENMETIVIKGGRRCTPQAECPLEHRIGDTATLVKCLWREHPSRTPSKFDGPSPCVA